MITRDAYYGGVPIFVADDVVQEVIIDNNTKISDIHLQHMEQEKNTHSLSFGRLSAM